MLKKPVYLDNNATTPCDPRVVEAMLPYFTENFGNAASRSHYYGWVAEEAVEHAREQVARLIGANPKEIIFSSGATEADNLALRGVFEMYAHKGKHIITVNTEHKAVLDTCKDLENKGASITYLAAHKGGLIDLEELKAAIRPDTIMIAVMYANNETGVIQPMSEISAITRQKGIILFTDAVQAAGKMGIDVKADDIDLLALSAHKMYGPKGVGALYINRKNAQVSLAAQVTGGGHEKGLRSGTLNVAGIVGLGKAAEIALAEMEEEALRLRTLRDTLEAALLRLEGTFVNGNTVHRLPHVTNVSFAHVEGEALLMSLNTSLAVSSGSACTSVTQQPSHVLKALGLADELALSTVRFSLGRFTTQADINFAIEQVTNTVNSLRNNFIHSRS